MGMILRIASSRIVGQGDIVGRSGYFSLNLSANSVMRGRLDARRTLKSLVADLRIIVFIIHNLNISYFILRHRRLQAAPQLHLLDKWELHQNNLRQQCCPTCDFFLYCGNSFLNGIIGRIYNIRFIYSQIAKLLPHCFY